MKERSLKKSPKHEQWKSFKKTVLKKELRIMTSFFELITQTQ